MGAGGTQVWGRCGRVWEVRWAFNHVSGPSILLGAGCARESCETVCVCAAPTMCSIDMCVREGVGEGVSHHHLAFAEWSLGLPGG